MPIPYESLPPWWREMVRAAAEHTQTDPDLILTTSVAVVAATMNGRSYIRAGNYRVPTHLWTTVVSESGSGKTPALRVLVDPLLAAFSKAAAPGQIESTVSAWDHLLDEDISATTADAAKVLRQRQRELYPEHPPQPLVDDSTPEAMLLAMEHQEMRSIQFAAEGGFSSFIGTGQKAQRILKLMNTAWDGTMIRVQRVGRDPQAIDRPALTMGNLIQIEPWRELMKSRMMIETGLLPRMLLCRAPKTRRRAPFEPIPERVDYAYRQGINRMLMRPPVDLVLSRDALEENANQFNAFMELEEGEGGPPTLWISKAPQNMLRLAGLIHLASLPDERTSTEVGPEAVLAAAGIVRAMLEHARVLVGDTPSAPAAVSDTDRVMQAARERFRSEPFSQSQISGVTGRQFLGRPDALGQALRDGVRQGLLRELPEARTGGRPVVRYELRSS